MRSRVKTGGLEMLPNVLEYSRRRLRHSRSTVGRTRHRSGANQSVDVVHAKTNAFHVKRADRAFKRFALDDNVGCRVAGRTQQPDQLRDLLPRCQTVIDGHRTTA